MQIERAATSTTTPSEKRRERRFRVPVLEVAIGRERFYTINWSMGGALLDGLCDLIGSRIRGVMRVTGSREPVPFAATVIRADPATGNCALCFDDLRTEGLEFDREPMRQALH